MSLHRKKKDLPFWGTCLSLYSIEWEDLYHEEEEIKDKQDK